MTVAVVGLGYVGLPLAVHASLKGHKVIGIDVNQDLVDMINSRKSPFTNDARFDDELSRVTKNNFLATTDFDALTKAHVIVICVPTPTEDNNPDLSYVVKAAKAIAKKLHKGQLIVLESTVSPGVTRDDILPILEKTSKLVCGTDFYLAHCPERIDPGNDKYYVGNLNRVIGGITDSCTQRAMEFYLSIIDAKLVMMNSTEEAEFVKSWENTQRNVMIALANEAAVISDALGMNISSILRGLQSKVDQFGLTLARPGIGPGGHCIPEDIHYVIKGARQKNINTVFLDSAASLNDAMPSYAISKLKNIVKQHGDNLRNLNIAVLGMAYKPNISDARRSPAIEVASLLVQNAKRVIIHDPYVNLATIHIKGAKKLDSVQDVLEQADIVFVATAHSEYVKLTPAILKSKEIKYVFDGRNCLNAKKFEQAGLIYTGIGI